MPYVVNGCGTWYHFKRNVQHIQGLCEQCGSRTQLTSYDTWLFFVIVFIPVIPLGRKRIICQCAACQKHLAMPLADYRRLQERAAQAQQKLEQTPSNVEAAKEAFSTCVPVRDLDQFLRIAPTIEKGQSNNADSMLMLAAGYDVFGRKADVERMLTLALQAKDSASTREAMACCLIDQGKLAEAEPYVAHVIDEVIPDRVDLLYQLAQMYQIKGNHEKALEYFQHCTDVAPALANQEVFGRLRAASEQALGTAKIVKPAEIVSQMKRSKGLRRLRQFTMAALALLSIGYVLYCAYLGQNHRIYVVSGVDRPYTVKLDDQSHRLMPFATWPVYTSEGRHTISTEGLAKDLPPTEAKVRTGFFARPFSDDVVVINPDRCAVLVHQKAYYSETPHGHDDLEKGFGGEMVTIVPDVDYPFQPFPSELRLPSKSTTVAKTRVIVAGSDDRIDRAQLLALYRETLPVEILGEIAGRRVEYEGPNSSNVMIAVRFMGEEKAIEFLRPKLSARPAEVEVHRAYQVAMEQMGKSRELLVEYESYLAKEPNDADLQYLVARETGDPKQGLELLLKSASAAKPCPYTYIALGYQYLACGEYETALEWLNRAPAHLAQRVRHQKIDCLDGLGRHAEALAMLKDDENSPFPGPILALWREIALYGALGQREQAEAAIHRVLEPLKGDGKRYVEAKDYALALMNYSTGRLEDYHLGMGRLGSAAMVIQSAMTKRDLAEAERQAESAPKTRLEPALAYIVAVQTGDTARAESYKQLLLDGLRKGDLPKQAFADALEHGGDWDRLRLQAMDVDEKKLLLTALGLCRPELRDGAFALAQQLNFDRSFPYLLIRDVVSQDR